MRSLLRTALVFAAAINVHAQTTGELRLEIKDPSGAAVDATGTLTAKPSGMERRFSANAHGTYSFDRLPLGQYELHLAKRGFVSQTLAIELATATPLTKTITLEVAGGAFRAEVVATTPLPGVDLARDQIPAPVQTATRKDFDDSGALELSDLMNRRLSGVHVNEVQGNPYQADVNYRGYTASPLLGTPQGLSVYMDGVRLNQPFGDVVSWDLIPRIAIAEVTLMPGSNPLFGLNTLGGALAVETKDGVSRPGTSLELSGGSFGRKVAQLEHGGANSTGLSWYLAANLFFEDGWRESSPSNVRQFFGKLGWQRARTTLGLSVGYANNGLIGNAFQDQRFFAAGYSGVYTKSDANANRSPFLNVSGRHAFSENLTVFGNAYYRYIRTNTQNGDINEDSFDQSVYQPNAAERAALTAAGYSGFPLAGENATNTPYPFWRCIAQVLLRDEPGEKCNGLVNRTHTMQHSGGVTGQLSWHAGQSGAAHPWRNQFTVGGAFDRSSLSFDQSTQLGYLNPDRSITPLNAFADGVTGGLIDGEPFDTRVNLNGLIHTASVYATDTVSLGNKLHVTLSGRFNRTAIENRDQLLTAGAPGSLSSNQAFTRFNPAAGFTYNPSSLFNLYFSFSEGSRAPTSVELGCADPDRPCKLPNAMTGDPPLNQVVTRTFEGGVRGKLEGGFGWSAGWFRSSNRDDIQFVASAQNGFGYFKNFGKTLRQGVEIDVNSKLWRVTLGGGYTFLDATYQSAESFNGASNSSNSTALAGVKGLDGNIEVVAGERIPLIPQHLLKAYADLQATRKLTLDLGLIATSSSFARGNENNRNQGDGVYYIGSGVSPGYAVLNLGGRFQMNRHVQFFAQVNNLLDRHYFTAAQLGPTGFAANHTFLARPFPAVNGSFPVLHTTFLAPGAPIGAWGGVRFQF